MMHPVDRDRFLEEGYMVVREAVPRTKLMQVRQAYETLVNQQREHWRSMRKGGDPPGGEWETSPQPRLMLQRPPLVSRINEETAPAVEVWLEPNIQGISSQLLGVTDAAVTEMMMMCNPVRDRGPAKWHRDHHPIDTAPLQGYIDDILEGGPRYVQWNIPLYDDNVLWVVPGSHVRYNTEEENELMLADPCQPLPNGVQTHLEAGDGVVYILPILHWGSNYSPRLRRTIHGGFCTHTAIDDPSFLKHLSTGTAAAFERWNDRSNEMKGHTEDALRAVIRLRRRGLQRGAEPASSGQRRKGRAALHRLPVQGRIGDPAREASPLSRRSGRPRPATSGPETPDHAELGLRFRRPVHGERGGDAVEPIRTAGQTAPVGSGAFRSRVPIRTDDVPLQRDAWRLFHFGFYRGMGFVTGGGDGLLALPGIAKGKLSRLKIVLRVILSQVTMRQPERGH